MNYCEDLQCPECGQSEEFIVQCGCTVRLTTEDLTVMEDAFLLFDSAPCSCPRCQYQGPTHLFRLESFTDPDPEPDIPRRPIGVTLH